LFFVFAEIFSQNDKVLRVEIPVVEQTVPFSVLNFKEKGLLVHSKSSFYFFNKYLTNVWKHKIILPDNMAVSGNNIINGNIYLIACNAANYSSNNKIFMLVFDMTSGDVRIDTLPNPAKEPIVKSFVHNSKLWNIHKGSSNLHIVAYNIETMGYYEYQLNKFSKQEILDIQLDTNKNLLHILYTDDKRNDGSFSMLTLTENAEELQNITTKFDKFVVVDSKIILDGNNILLAGSYNVDDKNIKNSVYDNVRETSGFFCAKVENGNVNLVSKLNYTDFNIFLTELSPEGKSQYDRIKRSKGELSMNNLVQLKVIPHNGKIFISAESFKRETTTKSESYYDYYGRVMPVSRIVFEGYNFNDVYFAEIDYSGKFIFNRVVDISSGFLSENLDNHCSILPDETPILLMAKDNNISYFDLTTDKKFSLLPLQTLYKSDIVKDAYNNGIDFWCGNSMFAFGYQIIQNKQVKGGSKRSVFYLTKLVLD
jgi:hypothetical protein